MTPNQELSKAEKNNMIGQLTVAAALFMGQGMSRDVAMNEAMSIFAKFVGIFDAPAK